jgi:hypothetical protein
MISAFEYVTVFISIILGLGVTQILTGVADLVHQSDRVRIYWPHMVWVAIVLILHVQEWYITFELRTFNAWRLPVFLLVLLYPIILFITARLLFPFGLNDDVIDLKDFYYKNYRKIFLFGAILALISIFHDLFLRVSKPEDFVGPALVLTLLSGMALLKISNPIVHKGVALFMLIVLIASIIIQWNEWLIVN